MIGYSTRPMNHGAIGYTVIVLQGKSALYTRKFMLMENVIRSINIRIPSLNLMTLALQDAAEIQN
ncbi:MAG: hypothetical protein ABIS36_05825 [Chryseolinea sp.]